MQPITTVRQSLCNNSPAYCKYHQFFEGQTYGVAYCQIVLDAHHEPVDILYLEVNDAYERITGLGRDKVVGKRFLEIYGSGKGDSANIIVERGRVALTGQERQSDHYMNHLSAWYSVYVFSPQKGYFVSVFTDITERKRLEQERDHLFNLSLDMLSVASFDGHLERVNAAWTRCLGWTAEEMTSRPWLSFVHPEDHAATIRVGEALAQGREVREFENRYLCKDGTYRWLSWNSRALPETRQMFSVARDITSQKDAARELQDSHAQLRALAARLQTVREEQSALIAREIHDVLAQELTRLKIDLVWLDKRLAAPIEVPIAEPMRATLSARISDATQLADTAISSVQRIATELRPVILDSLGLFAAVEWLVEEFAHRAELDWKVTVPQALEGDNALPDRDRSIALFRILQQSLTNVARHARATAIDVRLTQDGQMLKLTIKDNGVGITQQQKMDVRSIGLVGIRERVLAFGGSADFQGKPGQGTLVTVLLPLEGQE
jgi:PAS domain S-box-containing protein